MNRKTIERVECSSSLSVIPSIRLFQVFKFTQDLIKLSPSYALMTCVNVHSKMPMAGKRHILHLVYVRWSLAYTCERASTVESIKIMDMHMENWRTGAMGYGGTRARIHHMMQQSLPISKSKQCSSRVTIPNHTMITSYCSWACYPSWRRNEWSFEACPSNADKWFHHAGREPFQDARLAMIGYPAAFKARAPDV